MPILVKKYSDCTISVARYTDIAMIFPWYSLSLQITQIMW
jgi:hypothetical protein